MKKLFTFLSLILCFAAKSQSNVENALAVINQETTSIENSILEIESVIQKDRHKDMETQIHILKNSLTQINTQVVYLPEDHRDTFVGKLKKIEDSSNQFERRVHKSTLFDSDKELNNVFSQLQGDAKSVKSYASFMKTVIENQIKEAQRVSQESEKMKHDTTHEAQEKDINENTNQKIQEVQSEANQKNRVTILGVVKNYNTDIQTNTNKIIVALKRSDYGDVIQHTREINTMATRMRPLLGSLTNNEKVALETTNSQVIDITNKLIIAAKKGKANHHDIHHHFDELKEQATTLKAQLSLIN